MQATKTREIDMTEGPIFGKIFAFAIPLMISGILQCLYNAADMIVVGRFAGELPLAAVGATGSLIALFVNLFIAISVGTSVTVATAIGARNRERTQRLIHTSITLALICGLFVTVVGILFSRTFLEWMGTPADIIDLSALYMRIYFSGAVFSMLYNFGAAILRASGDSRRPLYFLAISGVVNVALNLVFVLMLGMSADGVALATVASQFLSAVLVVITLLRHTGACRLSIRQLRLHASETWDVLRTGVPAGIQSVVFSLSNSIIQASINSFDTAAVAGNTAASNLDGFIYTAMNAMHTTAVTAVGQNIGAGKPHRLGRITLSCLTLVTLIGLVCSSTILLFSNQLLSIYLPNSPEALDFAMIRLSMLAFSYILCGWMDTIVGVSRGLGNTFAPMVVSVVGVCGIRLAWIFTVFPANRTLPTLYLSYPISWIFTTILQAILMLLVVRRVKRHFAANRQRRTAAPADGEAHEEQEEQKEAPVCR